MGTSSHNLKKGEVEPYGKRLEKIEMIRKIK